MDIINICRSGVDTKVFTYLALMCGEAGTVRCTVSQLAATVALTEKQVRGSLSRLEAGGFCTLKSRGRSGTDVTMPWGKKNPASELGPGPVGKPEKGELSGKFALEGAEKIDAESCASAPTEREEKADNRTLNHFRESNSVGSSNARTTDPSSNPPISPLPSSLNPDTKYFLTRKEAVEEVASITRNEAVRAAACEWIAMRYAKRGNHRLTAKAIRGAFQKLRNMGYNSEKQAVACFEQSIEHLWDGVFELKE